MVKEMGESGDGGGGGRRALCCAAVCCVLCAVGCGLWVHRVSCCPAALATYYVRQPCTTTYCCSTVVGKGFTHEGYFFKFPS